MFFPKDQVEVLFFRSVNFISQMLQGREESENEDYIDDNEETFFSFFQVDLIFQKENTVLNVILS